MKSCFPIFVLTLLVKIAHADITLDQVISRESPHFRCQEARMTVGRDGMIYLTSDHLGKGYCLRFSRDGREKFGGEIIYAIHNATANRDGLVVSANAHFNHSLNLYDRNLQKLTAADDFLVNDQVGWDAPCHVEAGPSGDFYGLDQHRNRVVRVGPDGKVKAVYTMRAAHEADWGVPNDFRVSESLQAFYWLAKGHLIRTNFDGSTVWKVAVPVQYRWDVGSYGGWDIDEAGQVFLIEGTGDTIRRYDPDGNPQASVALKMDALKPTATESVVALRIHDREAIVRRTSLTELFQVYDLDSGERKQVVPIDHERLTVTFPSLVWINGETIPLSIRFQGPQAGISPKFRIWMSPFGISDWMELPQGPDSTISVPSDAAGLYQIKITPETTPRQTDEPSEYVVREIIEIRRPESIGTVAVATRNNRCHYALTETIRGHVIARSKTNVAKVEVRLRDRSNQAVVASKMVDLKEAIASDGSMRGEFVFEKAAPEVKTGQYQLDVDVPNMTCVHQRLVLGSGRSGTSDFRTMLYGDYGLTCPQRNAWEAADSAVAHGNRVSKLGINQFVNRTQQLSLDFANDNNGRGLLNRVKQRLQADPLAVTPEKAELGTAHDSIAAIYSANGWREYLMLMYMDSGLPVGTGFDHRTPSQFADAIRRFTEAFSGYSGFAGWAWVANWWIFDANSKFKSPDEKTRYEAALKQARETGRWDSILDEIDDRKYQYAVDAQTMFQDTLKEVATKQSRSFVTASAGPYRRPEVLPEINFKNVNEIDVHYQAEQITTPDWIPHGVDVSRRKGQPVWIHPELWNDFGTGEQILPGSWLAIARGTDGIGSSGNIPNWANVDMQSRLAFHGTTSIFRSLNRTVSDLLPTVQVIADQRRDWHNGDRVGIVVSPRQLKIETFGNGVGSPTFSRQFEAYQSFLYANCPARFVSLEEVKSRLFSIPSADLGGCFDALLLVGQSVELEPDWQQFLHRAKAAGIKILADGTCRHEIHSDAEPLGLKFDSIEKEHSVNSDHAHVVYPDVFIRNADALESMVQSLKAKSRRPADVVTLSKALPVGSDRAQRPVVILQEHETPQGRVVFVSNNTPTTLSPGQLRRVGLAISTRSPVLAELKFNVNTNQRIVDLFTHQDVSQTVIADLRDSYARVYRVEKKVPAEPTTASRPRPSFGPHLRDVAVSSDESVALLNACNWDNNLYAVDLKTGAVRFRERLGDHFAYEPRSTSSGFAVQGYDLNSAEGYHLYLIDKDGRSEGRFALPGLPGCLTGWAFTAWIQDRINNFAIPRSGQWVAGCGNLGLAVWDRTGKVLWSEDWSRTQRRSDLLESLNDDTLIQAQGMTVTARRAKTGQEKWKVVLGKGGEIVGVHPAADGRTLAIRSTASGGRVFVIRDGHVNAQLLTPADDVSLSKDGHMIAVTSGHQLKVFSIPSGTDESGITCLQWLAHGDDVMRFPRVSPDGQRIAVCSELGTLSIFSAQGEKLHERDEYSIVVPAWLANGDLIAASWTGSVVRIDSTGKDLWRTEVRDGERLPPGTAIAKGERIPDQPTSRITSWAVASTEIPDRKNLLAPNQFLAQWMMGTSAVAPVHPVNALADGKYPGAIDNDAALTEPWVSWHEHGMIESGWRGEFALVIDTFNRQLRIDSITLVDDKSHPESWLRDVRLERWDSEAERWIFADYLTSDSVIHSHKLKQPIEAARIRFVKADGHAWPAGNVRLQELMLHGESLGASHPDVIARRPVATLFDENVASIRSSYEHGHNAGLKFATGADAFSGGNYITIPADKKQGALWQPPFGHMTPNWLFEIAEKPEPGQYRYLQLSVKGLSAETKGITLQFAPSHYGGLAIHLGQLTTFEGATPVEASASVPYEWHTVVIDLWKHLPENQRGKPFNISAMSLGAIGGPAAIDKIRLGRTSEDLQE